MTIEQFILQAREKDVTDDTLRAGVQSLIDDAVGALYNKVDATLAAHGLQKPAGTKTLDYLQTIATELKGKGDTAKELAALKAELEQSKANAKTPADIDALQKGFEQAKAELVAKHSQEVGKLQSDLLAARVDGRMVGLNFKPEHKDSAAELLAMYRQNMLSSYKLEGEDMKLKKADGTFEMQDGAIVTADMYLRTKLKPFIATEQSSPPRPPAGTNTALSGMTTAQIAEYAAANGIDVHSAAGQQQIRLLMQGTTDGAPKQ